MMLRSMITIASLLLTGAAVPRWRAAELGQNGDTQWSAAQLLVYHDATAFRGAWTQLYPDAGRRPALPSVDFSRWRVLVVTAGDQPTGGYRMTLDSANATRDSAWVYVSLIHPPAGCGLTEQITHPAVAIAAPATPEALRVMRHERADTARCH